MVLFALSFQDQVEKYGAYVGIAAFFGLAVLSLLYFSQARELKRLREWAGRAPERARDLEQRVVAQATATVARRPQAMPGAPVKAGGAIAPPRRLAEMPAPPVGAQTAAGAQATELAEAVEADPATNGNVPAAVPAVGPGGSVPAGPVPGTGDAETDGVPAGDEASDGADVPSAPPAASANRDAAAPEAERDGGEGADVAGAQGSVPAAPPGQETQPAGFPAADEPVPGEIPAATAVPRATPAQRVGVTPGPGPMPLRQAKPSATPRGAGGGRRPATPAARRPGPKPPREGRSAGTIALLVGLAVLILGGGAFVGSQLLGGDDQPTPPNEAAPPPTESPAQDQGGGSGNGNGGGGAQAPPVAETNVAVLNGTTFTGLAGQLADEVAADGYQRGITETNTRDQTIQESVVYYADGFRASARAVGKLLSIEQFEPLDSETASLAPGADVVVLAGADQAP
jgi:LytR cell envelope-related transcriptional attenuator